MNRLSILLLLSLSGLSLQGQGTSPTTISTNPPGAVFQVDGTTYNRTVTFSWATGSQHLLVFVTDPPLAGETTNSFQTDGSTQYQFGGWVDSAKLLQPTNVPIQEVTANPAITSYTATVSVAYLISLNYFSSGNPTDSSTPPTCGAPGAIPPGQTRPGV